MIQNEVAAASARSSCQHLEISPDLVAQQQLGHGGFGTVYKGTYQGATVAIKVMAGRQHERQAMKDAMEMAVLMTISHPNTVQVGRLGQGD